MPDIFLAQILDLSRCSRTCSFLCPRLPLDCETVLWWGCVQTGWAHAKVILKRGLLGKPAAIRSRLAMLFLRRLPAYFRCYAWAKILLQ